MLRVRIQLPKQAPLQEYDHYDLLHDAIINAWKAAGARSEDLISHQAKAWTFAPLGWHRGKRGLAYGLVITTVDATLAMSLSRLDPALITKRRWDGQSVNFSGAQVQLEPDPILPQQGQLACLLLSPLLLQDTQPAANNSKQKYWHKDLQVLGDQLSERVNRKLSFIAEREVNLVLEPDGLYLRANPEHSVLVNLKVFKNGQKSFVVGMKAPLVLQGSDEDLCFAWYAGIGEKTRSGFGCLGLAEEGVGR